MSDHLAVVALDHVGLSVGDLDAQSRWYSEALDLQILKQFEIATLGLRGAFVVHESGWAIELLERAGSAAGTPAPDPNTALLTRGFGQICLRVADLDPTYRRLLAAGAAQRMPLRASPESGVRMAFLADPEGNVIELVDRPHGVGHSQLYTSKAPLLYCSRRS